MDPSSTIPVLEIDTGHVESWILSCEVVGPRDFRLNLEAGDRRRWTIEDWNVFDCLMRLRLQTEEAGWLICCNGARREAWCSGMARDMGHGELVYLLDRDLQGQRPPTVHTLDPVAPELAVTVREQFQGHADWLALVSPERTETGDELYADWLSRHPE